MPLPLQWPRVTFCWWKLRFCAYAEGWAFTKNGTAWQGLAQPMYAGAWEPRHQLNTWRKRARAWGQLGLRIRAELCQTLKKKIQFCFKVTSCLCLSAPWPPFAKPGGRCMTGALWQRPCSAGGLRQLSGWRWVRAQVCSGRQRAGREGF